ncbi:hypothetical protein DUNSADRAFT_18478 [Dunaliella salina]|uniref:Uncharacterized protein n=1 Tax=Dunaliella salina TaxID=3046 RepID=A0ABQ7GYY3_DUNSA|nr:hypothetical protein DUNSADRAFT_18478 [Dunaliella salina]|eukprot:KAF5839816.1 hypothetical protein DUNSADRAFT_18478 [Dunaliella salina]
MANKELLRCLFLHTQPPLYYEWPAEGGSPYLGAAHGLMGILYAMLHCPPLLQDPMAVMDIKAGIRYVLAHEQDVPGSPSGSGGHYPTQMGQLKRNSDRVLVHWCHGAPGAVFLLCKAHEVFGGGGDGAAYLPAACRAGEVVWSRGLLRKGPGLCHGVAGNGFALHRLWKSGAGAKWLHRSQQFGLALGDEEVQQTFHNPDNPYSLFQGSAAGLSFIADVLAATNAQHHHVASLGTDAGPVKASSVPMMLGFPLYEP